MTRREVDELTRTEPLQSPLEQARRALSALEREETDARQQLTFFEARDEQLAGEVTRDMERGAMAPRLDDLLRRREELARQRAGQWQALREVRDRLHAARRRYAEVQRHAVELHHAVRREGRAVAQWQRQIKDAEEQLARWQRLLTEAQARLERAQRELGELTGTPWTASPDATQRLWARSP